MFQGRKYSKITTNHRVPKGLIMEKNATLDFTFGNSSTYMRGPFAIKFLYCHRPRLGVIWIYIYTYITHIFDKCSQSFYEQSHTFEANFGYTIRTSMRFPLLWYVDGLCTIKIVEMANKSLYALKLRNNGTFIVFYKFGTKKATYEMKN